MSKRKTIAVIGGGSAGFTAARTACTLGAKVLFFVGDKGDHASLCINAGCMPSKAIFEPIDAMHHAKRHGWLTVEPKQPDEYLAQIIHWKDAEIAKFRQDRHEEIRALADGDFEVICTDTRFISAHEVISDGKKYQFDDAILATGSVTTWPKIDNLDHVRDGVWTSNEILHNTRIPKSLAVIGAGAVGLEFSLRYARFGSRVTLLAKSKLLSDYPEKFGERLALIYEKEGIDVRTKQRVKSVTQNSAGEFMLEIEGDKPIVAEKLLVATGRHPALDDVDLAAAGIALSAEGRLTVDGDMRIAGTQNFFAAGDVAGLRMVVHHAHIEAGIAAENACRDENRTWTKRSNIQVIFSDPEFAFAGMQPAQARQAGCELVSAGAESRDVGKLHLAGDDLGFGEFFADARDGRLISAGLLCCDAANLIHLPAYAIEHNHTINQLADAEFYHPTKIEIVSEIGDQLCRKLGGHPFPRAPE